MQNQKNQQKAPEQIQQNPANNQKEEKEYKSSPSHSYSSISHSSDHSRSNSSPNPKEQNANNANNQQQHKQQKKQGQKQTNQKQKILKKQPQRRIRYKYCCKICKHTDKSKKACVCVVPKDQRRTQIGDQGCQTCSCHGCSKEDFISRGQDPEYKPGDKQKRISRKQKQLSQFQARNGCCRKCMKAFSRSNKSCLCQVPQSVRNTRLPSSGCKICGCYGCNPEDKKDNRSRRDETGDRKQRQRNRSPRSRQKHRRHTKSSSFSQKSSQQVNPSAMNFYNIQKSIIGSMIVNQFRICPEIVGFGIPQRSHSYIMGKPK